MVVRMLPSGRSITALAILNFFLADARDGLGPFLDAFLDGVGAGLLGIVTPVAAERLLSGTGRFNVGFAAVMMLQGVGASLSNVVAGWLTAVGGYGLSHQTGAGIALIAIAVFLVFRNQVIVPEPAEGNP